MSKKTRTKQNTFLLWPFGNTSNNGLAPYIDWLEAIYNSTYYDIVSRADFWQVAAIAATEMAITQNNNAVAE